VGPPGGLTYPIFPGIPPAAHVPCFRRRGAFGVDSGAPEIHLRSNEIIVTLMLNYIGILSWIPGLRPWKDPTSFGFPMTPEFSPGATVGHMGVPGSTGESSCVSLREWRAGDAEIHPTGLRDRGQRRKPPRGQLCRIHSDRLIMLVMAAGAC